MRIVANNSATETVYYPHHCVICNGTQTNKIRVIFDASATIDNGVLLSHIQVIRSTSQDNLFLIFVRFRTDAHVVSADVEKMFRQILQNKAFYKKYYGI